MTSRYPVTLYTSKDCAPCNSGRNLLNARGIPYTEKTITTAQDAEALKRLNSDGSMPFLTIGGQQIKGYSDGEWSQYLDAAGYPKQSQLPSGYQRPAPSPGGRQTSGSGDAQEHDHGHQPGCRRAGRTTGDQSGRHPLLRRAQKGMARRAPIFRSSTFSRRRWCPAGTRWPSGARTRPPSPRPATG